MKKLCTILILIFVGCSFSNAYSSQVKIKAKKSQNNYEFEVDINKTSSKLKTNYIATQGCCSRHGGVCGCDSSGYSRCCDGALSPSCRCK